ncbi:fructokinase [Hymenobacter daecheongensis DSM 21074]|uniref:Fructokinase n=1 Tax=Hymenobacter daecheongensis DSM 21074 TaxID=1121955 RepID=A0A1M6I0L7_9BACT|nr:carbohydrate kinase family protein [Hymenobacter daecheongensis]SHJ27978.1 fructokinase [Hymenobacter daecheongensis DSM 21074]
MIQPRPSSLYFAAPPAAAGHGLLAIGEALIDILTTDFVGDLSQVTTLRAMAGGSPANLCRFVQDCGGTARLVAAVGQDGLGEILLRTLAAAGLSTEHIHQLPDRATSIIVVGRSRDTPTFIPYRSADRHLPPVEPALVLDAAVVHTTAFALSRLPAQDHILAALATATAHGRQVSVDWNYAAPIWRRSNNAPAVWQQLLSYQPLLKVSLDDVARFSGGPATVEAAQAFLHAVPARVLCLTCGADGVWYRGAGGLWQHQSAPAVTVHDATGAGDAFWAGFLTRWMQHRPLDECVQLGIQTAARRLQGQLA